MKYDTKNILRYIFILLTIIAFPFIKTGIGYYFYFSMICLLIYDIKNKDNSLKTSFIFSTAPWIVLVINYILGTYF